ncbi:MAG: hypothetical protein WEA99_01970 [Brumimicrobium sp.]
MMAYDKITFAYGFGSESHSIEGRTENELEGQIFRAAVKSHPYISLYLPKNEDNMKHTRHKKSLDESYYILKIRGSVITGYEEKWNDSKRAFIKKPIYKHTTLLNEKIPLRNREFVKGRIWGMIPVIGNIVRLLRKPFPVPERDENCYPCDGEKPDLYEFDSTKY